jgi:small ligand-binding sensory domain FIST
VVTTAPRAQGVPAASWEVKTTSPERVASTLSQAALQVRSPGGAIVFVASNLTNAIEAIAKAIADRKLGFPVAIAGGSGVLTDRGEIEDQPAATGVVWAGGRAELVPLPTGASDDVSDALVRVLSDRTGKTSPTVLLFLRPDGFGPSSLAALGELRGTRNVLGAGTVGDPGSAAVFADGTVKAGPLAMILRGLSPPVIHTAHSAKLLGPLRPITRSRGAMLFEIDGEPALDVLSNLGQKLAERQLLFLMLADEASPNEDTARVSLVVRGLQGIDPDRKALVVSDEIKEGMRVTFAVRDGPSAREEFEAVTRELQRDIMGAAPRFGLLIDCAGRGSGLYGAHDVDSKILRSRFPTMPFAGMASTFEIAPHFSRPTMQLYTAVVALFSSPS